MSEWSGSVYNFQVIAQIHSKLIALKMECSLEPKLQFLKGISKTIQYVIMKL